MNTKNSSGFGMVGILLTLLIIGVSAMLLIHQLKNNSLVNAHDQSNQDALKDVEIVSKEKVNDPSKYNSPIGAINQANAVGDMVEQQADEQKKQLDGLDTNSTTNTTESPHN